MLVSLWGILSSPWNLLAVFRLRRPGPETAPQSTALHKDAFGWREPRLLTLNLPRWEEEKGGGEMRRSSPSIGSLLLLAGLQGWRHVRLYSSRSPGGTVVVSVVFLFGKDLVEWGGLKEETWEGVNDCVFIGTMIVSGIPKAIFSLKWSIMRRIWLN